MAICRRLPALFYLPFSTSPSGVRHTSAQSISDYPIEKKHILSIHLSTTFQSIFQEA